MLKNCSNLNCIKEIDSKLERSNAFISFTRTEYYKHIKSNSHSLRAGETSKIEIGEKCIFKRIIFFYCGFVVFISSFCGLKVNK